MKNLPFLSVTEKLADAFLNMPELPPSMERMVDSLLVDVAGLCLSARNNNYILSIKKASLEPGNCTILGHPEKANAFAACLINGTAIHGEDFDDTFEGGPIHAGSVIIPAVLAAAEQHHLTGKDVARGIAVGCEMMCRMCTVAPKLVHKAGFHPTAVFGTIGATAAVATALNLPKEQWVNALGIAGSMASGIIEYLAEGTWTKRMHPGWSAQSGYRAARMAQEGFTGPRTLFEGEHGFFHAFANKDDCSFEEMLANVGHHWLSVEMAFKPYACGTMAHPYIDCAISLVKEGLNITQITSIECNTAEGIVHRLWEPLALKQAPQNGYAAKFSIPFAIAVGMTRGDAGLIDYEEHIIQDPSIRALAAKVSYVIDPNNPYPKQFTGHLKVTLKNGTVLEASQDHFRGGRDDPMSVSDIESKFIANCIYGGWNTPHAQLALQSLRLLRSSSTLDLSSFVQ